jgi:hypothetical protein
MRNLTFVWTVLVNLTGAALVLMFYLQGWLVPIYATDTTYVTYAMSVLFLTAVGLCLHSAWCLTRSAPPTGRSFEFLTKFYEDALSAPTQLKDAIPLLGLIGTIAGFALALAQVDPSVLAKGQSEMVISMFALIQDMGVSLIKTALGALLGGWVWINLFILERRTFSLTAENADV